MKKLLYFFYFSLVLDLRRKSSFALFLSTVVIGLSVAMCSVLFSFADQIGRSVDAEMVKSGAANALEVMARTDSDLGAPWAASPIGTTNSVDALNRLLFLLRDKYGADAVTSLEPFWTAPGWVYVFLTHPDMGGKAVSVGLALTSPTDPEGARVESEKLAGSWISDPSKMQLVLPKKVADQLWQDVLFTGETAWLGLTDDSVCAEVEIAGIYRQTQRGYCYASYAAASSVQSAITTSIEKDKSLPADGDVVEGAPAQLGYTRAWIYFRDRKTLLKARRLVEQEYKFEAKSPFDKFDGKIRLVTTAKVGAWTVLVITLGAACGSIFCTFLAWVSRRRYEIALLKAQGCGNAWVAGTYIVQSAVAGVLAGVVGVSLSQRVICPYLSSWITRVFELKEAVTLIMPPHVQVLMMTVAFLVAVLAALIPACIAARQDPWDVLREAA